MSKELTLEDLVKILNKNKRVSTNKIINALLTSGRIKTKEEAKNTVNRVKLNIEINELLDGDVYCPHCKSKSIRKKGYNSNGLLRYQCKDCKKTFNITTNTIFEGSKYPLDVWEALIAEMLHHHVIDDILLSLKRKFPKLNFSKNTLLTMRIKIMDLVSQIQDRYFLEHPFKGIIYMDEKFFKENQLGVPNEKMYNPYPKDRIRKSRHRSEPMKYGVMTADFANVLCIVDKKGRAYGKLISLGRTTEEVFNQYFLPIIDIPNISVVCTDAQKFFVDFCKQNHLMQCVTPANYYKEMNKIYKIVDEDEKKKQMFRLYKKGVLGYLAFDGKQFNYDYFLRTVNELDLRLDKVNKLHGNLENIINRTYKSVPTRNLNGYVSWICFIYNWKTLHGTLTNSTASQILKHLLKEHIRITLNDLKQKSIANIPLPKKNNFIKVKAINKKGKEVYYKYQLDPEHNYNDSKRKIIDSMSSEQMKDFCRHCKIKGFSSLNKTGLRKLLKSQSNFKDMYIAYLAYFEKEINKEDKTLTEINKQKAKDILSLNADLMKGLTAEQAIKYAGKAPMLPKYHDTNPGKTLFIDTETTGTNFGDKEGIKDEVLSICILDRFRTVKLKCYIKPIRHKEWKDAESVNGLSPQFINEHGMSHEDFKKALQPLLSNANEIISYNVEFDLYMLKEFIDGKTFKKLLENSLQENPTKCCMRRYAIEHDLKKWITLSEACKRENIEFEGTAHGAEADTKACYDLWMKMYPDYFS